VSAKKKKEERQGPYHRWRKSSGGDPRRKTGETPAAARFGEEGEARGRRVLVLAVYATKENEEAPRECFTGDEASGRPAMARRRDSLGGSMHTKVEMDEGLGRGKRVQQGLSRDL
jgi:hypothetical protein